MEIGNSGQGNLRYVPVTKIAAKIGPDMFTALDGLQACTGSDYIFAFARKGKSRPYANVTKVASAGEVLLHLATLPQPKK